MQIGNQFSSIKVACNAIQRYTLDDGKSYRVVASDKKRCIIVCKAASQTACKFRIRATQSAKGVTSITIILVVPQHTITQNQALYNIIY